MQIQQNIIFVDICNGKLLKHFISSLAFGWLCLIWHEVIKAQQRSLCHLNHSQSFPSRRLPWDSWDEIRWKVVFYPKLECCFPFNFRTSLLGMKLLLQKSAFLGRKMCLAAAESQKRMVWLKAFKELTVATPGLPPMQPSQCKEELVQGVLRGSGFL